jgi:hypothetical protein
MAVSTFGKNVQNLLRLAAPSRLADIPWKRLIQCSVQLQILPSAGMVCICKNAPTKNLGNVYPRQGAY